MTVGDLRKEFVADCMTSNLFRTALMVVGLPEAPDETELSPAQVEQIKQAIKDEFEKWER